MNNKVKLVCKAIFDFRLAKLLFYNLFSGFMSDRRYLEKVYPLYTGDKLNLDDPKTFGEKIQWLKLYNRNPDYPKMVDKYEVKQYVASVIGDEHIIPTFGVWDRPKDIDFDTLPNQFVLKTTNGGGSVGVIICKDKSKLDLKATIKQIDKCQKRNHARLGKEWVYGKIPRRVIAEQYLELENSQELPDYKFYCFSGEPRFCQVISNRYSNESIDFFDTSWNRLDFVGFSTKAIKGDGLVPKPSSLEKMLQICKSLSRNMPFVRIDLYEIKGQVYFGEITFFPASGFGHFRPKSWDLIIGEMIKLPIKNEK